MLYHETTYTIQVDHILTCNDGTHSIYIMSIWSVSDLSMSHEGEWDTPPNRHHINGLYPFRLAGFKIPLVIDH